MTATIVAIFCLTYVLIATRRLGLLPIGRPAGALLGAVLMVAVGALTPEESYRAIDHNTILLLFAMMLLTAYLSRAGFFEWTAGLALGICRSPWQLLVGLVVFSAVMSALLVNDTVCLFMTPVVTATCLRGNLPMAPYLMALVTSANIGSAATLVGNPQNMIIGSKSGFGFSEFLLRAAPAVAVGLALNVALLWLYYRRKLPASFAPSAEAAPVKSRGRLVLVTLVAVGVVAGFFAGFHLGYTTLAGVLVLVIVDRDEPTEIFARVDWRLLVFFSCLFIVVRGFETTRLPDQAWAAAAPHMNLARPGGAALFSGLMTAGSNIVSNVPMVLLTGDHLDELGSARLGWVLLAFTTTVAGNLTLLGSVANIIVAEGAKQHYDLGFFEYLRFGFISTLAVLAAGVPLVYWMGTAFP